MTVQSFELRAKEYSLFFAGDRPFVYLDDRGNRLAELFVLSNVHPAAGLDDTTAVTNFNNSGFCSFRSSINYLTR